MKKKIVISTIVLLVIAAVALVVGAVGDNPFGGPNSNTQTTCFNLYPYIDVLRLNVGSGIIHGVDDAPGYYVAPVLGKAAGGKFVLALDWPGGGSFYELGLIDGTISGLTGNMWWTMTGDDLAGPGSVTLVPVSCTSTASTGEPAAKK